MKHFRAAACVGSFVFLQCGSTSAQPKTSRVFFLEDTVKHQWCAFTSETIWKEAVQEVEALTVGTLIYSDEHLMQIDVTETDESGDWTVYDHYRLDDREQLKKLSRTINVLPGDRSVVQTFVIHDGKTDTIKTVATQLSTENPLNSAKPIWMPELPIATSTRMFPFAVLFEAPSLRIHAKSCLEATSAIAPVSKESEFDT
jgi:hypothetical protein